VGYAFISYSHHDDDRAVVERIVAQLRASGVEVWFDHSLTYGEQFPARLEKEIARSAVFVPVMSVNSDASKWVHVECDHANKYQREVMPISLDRHLFTRYEKRHTEMMNGDAALAAKFVTDMKEACRPSVRFKAGKDITGHEGAVRSLAFSPVADLLVSASDDHTLRLWDPSSRTERAKVRGGMTPTGPVAFTPDGTQVAALSRVQPGIHLWSAASAALTRTVGNHEEVRSFAFSPDGKLLVTGGGSRADQVWDATNGKPLQTLTARSMRPAWPMCFSPDGAHLAVANHGSHSVSLWHTNSLERTGRTDNKRARVTALTFDPTGTLVLSGLSDGGFELDTIDDASIRDLEPHTRAVTAVACSPTDKVFATAGADGLVKLISLVTGEELQVLSGHSGEVCTVAFSRDGQRLATAGVDMTIRLWHRD
jgi:WD40 repeat protein